MAISMQNTIGSSAGREVVLDSVSNSLGTLLAQQFLSIMTAGGEQNEFTGGTAAAQFKSFLNEYYAPILSEKGLFNMGIGHENDENGKY